ncbi:S1C family serine protease [Natranaerofaba carboxydovora]|uniref:S1C family serine protease n=1 Tax=Natranaerofaba carboxydovora TaxID=2742683 RepID=UPI001F137085|nr:trypsin-like peptidase domain-containing protein [Natranaerofaba carboxydovora]UMZ75149.1 Serine protease Do-like HtrB [Natranaerofaba carboxydovora]
MSLFDEFENKSTSRFKSLILPLFFGIIIGGIMLAIILPPVVVSRFEAQLEENLDTNTKQNQDEQISKEKKEELADIVEGEEKIWPFNDEEEDYQDTPVVRAANAVMPSVVGVSTDRVGAFGQQQELEGAGSGIIVDSDGYVVTNYHVIQHANEIYINIEEGDDERAEVIGTDQESDLALLKIEKSGLPAVEFGDSDELVRGELAVAIGNPLGLDFQRSVTSGVISAPDRTMLIENDYVELVQTDAAINPGNSGGPLVNAKGEVIGINSVKIQAHGVEGMGFAIPSNLVQDVVEELRDQGYVERPWLGIIVEEVDPFAPIPGMRIAEVENGSPADEAGLQRGDIILKMEDEEVQTLAELRKIRDQYEIGDEITITVMRGQEEVELDLVLGSPRN